MFQFCYLLLSTTMKLYIFILLGADLFVRARCTVSCLDEGGNIVDWYVVYKLPDINDHPKSDVKEGNGYLYYDSNRNDWEMAFLSINNSRSALGRTINQVYEHNDDDRMYHLIYNDDPPGVKSNSYRGHAKGVQLFDYYSGFWLIHSIPQFPTARGPYVYPENGRKFGQSALCVSFKSSQLQDIAAQLVLYQPSIYSSRLPANMAQTYPNLQDVVDKKSTRKAPYHRALNLTSSQGQVFTSFAKHKKWDKDLYSDMLAPNLGESIMVETWLNGPGDLPSSCKKNYKVNNVRSVRPSNIEFVSSKDHSKWAVGSDPKKPTVCIGDINRQESQSSRGGGAMCIKDPNLWMLFRNAVGRVECCADNTVYVIPHPSDPMATKGSAKNEGFLSSLFGLGSK